MRTITYLLAATLALPASAQQAWDLRQCIDYAIEHNLTIKQQEENRHQSEVDLNTAQWSRLPNLNGSASHSFNFGRSLQADNTYQSINTQNTNFSLNTSVPLFTGLQIPHNIALQKLNLKAATEDLQKAKDDISLQIASLYLQVLYNQELALIARQQVALSQEMLEQKKAYLDNGKASEAEWYEAKSRVAQDELSAVQAENNCRLALLDLSQLLELPTPDGFSIVSPDIDERHLSGSIVAPENIFQEAVLSKPAIKAATYRLEGAAHSIRMAQSAYYPQLSFGAGIGTNYYKVNGYQNNSFGSQLKDNFSQYFGFSLSVPIFNRFATRNQVRSARIRQNTLNWQLEEAKKSLFKEIQQAYYNALNAESQLKSSVTADEAAEASFQLMKEKYAQGKANATEYNESRTNWMKAVSNRLQAKYDYVFRTKILDFYRGIELKL
ncbi:MAG: TolC family protein [Phocaeicola plebeius]|nr:TolC family protein [Phocaeicola plebeius]